MALDIRSFFIGIATVFGILAAGFGGGVMMGGVISGNDTQGPNKLERQQAAQQVPKATKPETPPVVAATPVAPATAQAAPVPESASGPRTYFIRAAGNRFAGQQLRRKPHLSRSRNRPAAPATPAGAAAAHDRRERRRWGPRSRSR